MYAVCMGIKSFCLYEGSWKIVNNREIKEKIKTQDAHGRRPDGKGGDSIPSFFWRAGIITPKDQSHFLIPPNSCSLHGNDPYFLLSYETLQKRSKCPFPSRDNVSFPSRVAPCHRVHVLTPPFQFIPSRGNLNCPNPIAYLRQNSWEKTGKNFCRRAKGLWHKFFCQKNEMVLKLITPVDTD